jgi:hypothetical protein
MRALILSCLLLIAAIPSQAEGCMTIHGQAHFYGGDGQPAFGTLALITNLNPTSQLGTLS